MELTGNSVDMAPRALGKGHVNICISACDKFEVTSGLIYGP